MTTLHPPPLPISPQNTSTMPHTDPSPARKCSTDGRSPDMTRGDEGVNETSPLLPPHSDMDTRPLLPAQSMLSVHDEERISISEHDQGQGAEQQQPKSTLDLFLLTLSMGGLQIAWSAELSNGSPYLLSLGLSKSHLAIIWLAGPLSGILVQPYIGLKSDRCRSRFGRRRPFMLAGALATATSLLVLAWAGEIVHFIFFLFGTEGDGSDATKLATIVLAVLMIYILDFAINVLQAAIRAFVVDNAPVLQQDIANAWAARVAGVGNIIGYLLGYADLPRYSSWLGDTQFKVFCALATFALGVTVGLSCFCVKERDAKLLPPAQKQSGREDGGGAFGTFRELYHSARRLPRQIRAVCLVQFFAWIGWFPFLFYITTYIAEIHVRPYYAATPDMTEEEKEELWERATRMATFALFVFAITSFAASVVLPFFIADSFMNEGEIDSPPSPSLSQTSRFTSFTRILDLFPWRNPLSLRHAWLLSHLLFAASMALTFLVRTTTSATFLVALLGTSWALTNWAPFALIAASIRSSSPISPGAASDSPSDNDEGCAGIILGLHNIAVALPQVLATLISSAIFGALQKERGAVGDDSVAWVLRVGGLAALGAGWFCWRFVREHNREV